MGMKFSHGEKPELLSKELMTSAVLCRVISSFAVKILIEGVLS
jgi:hypothetical protein